MNTMYYNGQEYELAAKTMKIARIQEAAEMSETITEAYTNEFAFIRAAIGDGATREILGTISIEDVDLTEMVKLYNAIVKTYDADIIAIEREKQAELFDGPMFDRIRGLADDVRAITEIEKGKAKRK